MTTWTFCPQCRAELALRVADEDGGPKERLRCPNCEFVHWNNPTPVLAAVIECMDRDGAVLLARNAAWPGRFFGLVTGFMEAGESPEDGIRREVFEETALTVDAVKLLGAWDFQRLNQLIVAYHVQARGEIRLSPELAEYQLLAPEDVKVWPQGTGQALQLWLRSKGLTPKMLGEESKE